MIPAYIALGSNLGHPSRQLRRALQALGSLPDTCLEATSSVYRSAAVGPGEQPDYLNAVALMSTRLSPLALLDALQAIEREQGRVRSHRWGPRTLDLDVLLYGDLAIASQRLTVPHPRMRERHFVLYPLREICSDAFTLPDGTPIAALLRDCPAHGLQKTRCRLRETASRQPMSPAL